ITKKFKGFAMELVAATLGRDIHHRGVWSLIRHEKTFLNLELIYCCNRDIQSQFAVSRSPDRHAVQRVADRIGHCCRQNNRPLGGPTLVEKRLLVVLSW